MDTTLGAMQQAILTGYPNPTRKGCPGDEVITRLAEETARRCVDPADVVGLEITEHIFHCSPCYKEFLDRKISLKL